MGIRSGPFQVLDAYDLAVRLVDEGQSPSTPGSGETSAGTSARLAYSQACTSDGEYAWTLAAGAFPTAPMT
jgi:hypothetical protein